MSSNLRVNNILPTVGTNVAIGTAGGSITLTGTTSGTFSGNLTGNVNSTGVTTVTTLNVGTGASVSSPSSNVLTLGTNNAERLRITSSGNVGIGTDNPNERVTITSTTLASYIQLCDSSTGTTVNDGVFVGSYNGDVELKTKENKRITLGTNNTERLRITSSGQIGINTTTTTDSAQVQILGTTDGVLNLDTTDGRGTFIRFKENGTTKVWVGCAEGLITGTDQDDLGLRATDNIVFRAGSNEAARFNSSGNLVFPSGQGIDFSATSDGSGTMSSELLDDYEEGTWTPTIGGTATYTSRSGGYIKVGGVVHLWGLLWVGTRGTGSQNTITGLPYNAGGSISGGSVWRWYNSAVSVYWMGCAVDAGSGGIFLTGQSGLDVTSETTINAIGDNMIVAFSASYHTTL